MLRLPHRRPVLSARVASLPARSAPSLQDELCLELVLEREV